MKQETKIKICSVSDCDKKHFAKGFCRNHYELNRRNGFPGYQPQKPKAICSVENCVETAKIKGFCLFHYRRHLDGLSLTRPKGNSGELNVHWNGGTSEYKNHHQLKKNRTKKLKEADCICKLCGGEATETHHVDGGKENHATSNLLALCHECHMSQFHSTPRGTSKFLRLYGHTSKDIGAMLGVTATYVRRLHKKGKLPRRLKQYHQNNITK